MAPARSRVQAPIGSARWVLDEREQAAQFIEQEAEEFAFSARNELEWLNEHMAEVFSSNNFEVAEIFKTPGKLRGKTPRTARKHTPGQNRQAGHSQPDVNAAPADCSFQPLTDIFSSNTPNAVDSPKNDFYKKLAPFTVAEDKENPSRPTSPIRQKQSPLRPATSEKEHHVSPQRTIPSPQRLAAPPLPPRSPFRPASAKKSPSQTRVAQIKESKQETRSTGDSFVSAKEAQSHHEESASTQPAASPQPPSPAAVEAATEVKLAPMQPESHAMSASRGSHQYSVSTTTAAGLQEALEQAEQQASAEYEEPASSPSEASSPERPPLRKKSSLTFASLPAREPLSKKSVGTRPSQPRMSEKEAFESRSGLAREQHQDEAEDKNDESLLQETSKSQQTHKGSSDAPQMQSKTSTQRLHERITMLGKTNPRPSKSIPSTHAMSRPSQPDSVRSANEHGTQEDHDDDWIGPISQATTLHSTQPSMPGSFATSTSNWTSQTQDTTFVDSQPDLDEESTTDETAQKQAVYPSLKVAGAPSTTPAGSPSMSRWNLDGPLSASKAKFNSFLKSAKGMFASSAAASAQAKMETLNPSATKSVVNLPGTADGQQAFAAAAAEEKSAPRPGTAPSQMSPPKSPARRRSSQRLKDRVEKDMAAPELDKAPEPEQQLESEDDVDMTVDDLTSGPLTSPKHAIQKTKAKGLASQSGELRHPNKANKSNRVAKPGQTTSKSAFSIRVPSQKTIGTMNSSVNSAPIENKTPASSNPPAKAPMLTKKGSNSSLKSGTSGVTAKSTAANNARLKALDAAAKSKEREEREKQRKADEKRERERKRAEVEEERRKKVQEQKAAEQRREREEQEARAAVQKQRREREEQERVKTEKQQAEMQRKNELLRRQAEAAKAAKAAASGEQQADQTRPVSRGENLGGSVRPHINPAKPKRYFQPEEEESTARPQTAQTPGFATSQNGAKRRKTSEEGVAAPAPSSTRPTMAPPVRPSMAKKQEMPNRFTPGYMAAGGQTGPAVKGSTSYAGNQPKTPHQLNNLAKFTNAKIPFADGTGSANAFAQQQQQSHGQRPTAIQKTPGTAGKSSPAYPPGESIELPEIATDSEDSDDENDFVPPNWTATPELRAQLERQQLVDPMRVFGPIAPLAMDEVFKGSKERMARFRARTSSANWSGPDRLTEEERRKDREARERLERDGGWSFQPNL